MVEKKGKSRKVWQIILYIIAVSFWVFASLYISQLAIGYSMLFILGPDKFVQPAPTAIYTALSYIIAMILIMLLPTIVYRKWKSRNLKTKGTEKTDKEAIPILTREEIGLKGLPTWADIGLAVLGFIAYMFIGAGLLYLFSNFTWFNADEAQDVGFSIYISGIDRVIAFLALVVVAPIAEEIIFRGWFYDKVKRKVSEGFSSTVSMIVSALVISLVFGLVHMQWNVGVDVFAMSIILCGLRELTGTIYAGIIVHMIKNGLAFFILYVIGSN